MTVATFSTCPHLDIPDSAWEATGKHLADPRQRLRTQIRINDVPLYLEAYEIVDDEDSQHVHDPDVDSALADIVGPDCFPLHETQIAGRSYILVATPAGGTP